MQKKIIIILTLFFLISCSKNTIFTKFKSLKNHKWHKDSIVSFNYNTKDTLSKNAVFINLRNNKNYEFKNLYLIASVEFPNKTIVTDTLEYEMTDLKGNFLGTGFTDIKENKLEYKTNIKFPFKGDYYFKIQHAMRKLNEKNGLEYLNGITDIGIEIEKIEN